MTRHIEDQTEVESGVTQKLLDARRGGCGLDGIIISILWWLGKMHLEDMSPVVTLSRKSQNCLSVSIIVCIFDSVRISVTGVRFYEWLCVFVCVSKWLHPGTDDYNLHNGLTGHTDRRRGEEKTRKKKECVSRKSTIRETLVDPISFFKPQIEET